MRPSLELENRAGLCRITCGWKKAELPMDVVWRYWRDVHSPGIARRPGIWEYRHFQYDPVVAAAFAPLPGVAHEAPAGRQLMWQSDVRYLDDAALQRFAQVPAAPQLRQLLGDIELIVDRSTTYKVLGANGRTLVDRDAAAVPQGAPQRPTWAVFLRQRGEQAAFRAAVHALAAAWAAEPAVTRLRVSLFEVPDMEAERRSGYPIKTHDPHEQYQAVIDLSVADAAALTALTTLAPARAAAAELAALHAHPVRAIYTSVLGGRPTWVGLRGYPAYEAMRALDARNQCDPGLLQWMYGAELVGAEGPWA